MGWEFTSHFYPCRYERIQRPYCCSRLRFSFAMETARPGRDSDWYVILVFWLELDSPCSTAVVVPAPVSRVGRTAEVPITSQYHTNLYKSLSPSRAVISQSKLQLTRFFFLQNCKHSATFYFFSLAINPYSTLSTRSIQT